jgi:hypothetical protein
MKNISRIAPCKTHHHRHQPRISPSILQVRTKPKLCRPRRQAYVQLMPHAWRHPMTALNTRLSLALIHCSDHLIQISSRFGNFDASIHSHHRRQGGAMQYNVIPTMHQNPQLSCTWTRCMLNELASILALGQSGSSIVNATGPDAFSW